MSLFKQPDSENWWIDIRHNGQRIRRTTGSADKTAAQEYHDRIKASLWREARLDQKPQRTWKEAVKRWIDEHPHKKSLDDDKYRLQWLSHHLLDRPLSSITVDTTEELIKSRLSQPAGGGEFKRKDTRPVSVSTVNRHMSALAAVLNSAVKWDWISSAPKIRKLKEPTKRISHLTREEACKLIAELPMHLAEMAAFTLATGLRENNVLGIEWRDLDTKRRIAWVHGDQAKNAKPLAVPLNAEALAVIEQRKAAKENLRFVFSFRGKPIGKATNHAWHKATARAGIPEFHWHDLRHTWASWHVMSGTPIEVLMELGGWSDLRMVMRYAHLSPGHVARFADGLRPADSTYDQNLPTPKTGSP